MTQEALRMALEALITASGHLNNEAFVKVMMARDAVVEALAQTQEPFAWGVDWGKAGDIACVSIIKRLPNDVIEVVAVEYAPYSYTHPPQRTWVGLTNEEIDSYFENHGWSPSEDYYLVIKDIEAKLKELNT
jgi:hypothetical protein